MTKETNSAIAITDLNDKEALFAKAGEYHVKEDLEGMIPWLEKAAELGHIQAKTNLGLCYFFGNGTEQNYEQAFELFTVAASANDQTAKYYFGLCYLDGTGVEQDEDYAMRVLWKCAADGMPWAQFTVAECYETGRVVKQDLFEAIGWYAHAAEANVPEAQKKYQELYYSNEFRDDAGNPRLFWFEEDNMEEK